MRRFIFLFSFLFTVFSSVTAQSFRVRSDEFILVNSDPSTIQSVQVLKTQLSLRKITQMQSISYNGVASFENEVVGNVTEIKENTMKNDSLRIAVKNRLGLDVSNLEKIVPEAVITDKNGLKSIDYNQIIPLLVGAIQEQNDRICRLEYNNKLTSPKTTTFNNGLSTGSYLQNNYPNGIYAYSLVIDNNIVDSKTIIISE